MALFAPYLTALDWANAGSHTKYSYQIFTLGSQLFVSRSISFSDKFCLFCKIYPKFRLCFIHISFHISKYGQLVDNYYAVNFLLALCCFCLCLALLLCSMHVVVQCSRQSICGCAGGAYCHVAQKFREIFWSKVYFIYFAKYTLVS